MSVPTFHILGPSHVAVLLLTAAGTVIMIALARRGMSKSVRVAERLLALILLGEWPCNLLLTGLAHDLNATNILPAHLCDVAAIIGGLALLTKKAQLCELLYLWGLAGTLQGLLTPALELDFPQLRFFVFFALHSGVVIAALYIVLGARVEPRCGAVKRAMIWLALYAGIAMLINTLLASNYGFLRTKPVSGSLLDYLGAWPWYIGPLGLLALVMFTLLDFPFARKRGAW